MQLQNIQDHAKLCKMTWNSSLRRPFDKTKRTLVKVLAAGLLLVFRDKRAAICHTYSMCIHKFIPVYHICFKKCLWHVSTKLSLPLSFHCSSKLQAACYSLHRLKYPTLHATLSSWHQPPFTCTPPLFPSGHPSVTNSRFEVSSRWPNVVTLRRYAPCPWFHHNSTVTLKKIDVSHTNWWIHSAHRCGVSPVPNIPKIMPLTRFLLNITIW